jgi:hypothetical protein
MLSERDRGQGIRHLLRLLETTGRKTNREGAAKEETRTGVVAATKGGTGAL